MDTERHDDPESDEPTSGSDYVDLTVIGSWKPFFILIAAVLLIRLAILWFGHSG